MTLFEDFIYDIYDIDFNDQKNIITYLFNEKRIKKPKNI